ncbi:MAG: tripartite tricarboxylate transporter TctB family protein [Paracoccaceae bacterium]
MDLKQKHAEYLAYAFLLAVVGVVFQQIATSFAEQGIASGGPFDNAAAYPRAVAILIVILIALQLAVSFVARRREGGETLSLTHLACPAAGLAILFAYIWSLNWLGYHIATPSMIAALMILGGSRRIAEILIVPVAASLLMAFAFEVVLKIVLPGGVFKLHILWPF